MIDKIAAGVDAALGPIRDGSTVLIGGFGFGGTPYELIEGLVRQAPRELTIVCNNAGTGDTGIAALLLAGCVRKIICSFPRQADSYAFDELYRAKKLELELVPQGTLAERIRAGGAGIGGFFTRTGAGTLLAKGKEAREIDGQTYIFEKPIQGDLALIQAEVGDRWGNLVYRKSGRNFGPVMATAARHTVAAVHRIAELGALDPEHIVTPAAFVNSVVQVPRHHPLPASHSNRKAA
jgi:3-oxoadipate CoA-transferase alpha subunit